jgi:PPM family protein phosphatase
MNESPAKPSKGSSPRLSLVSAIHQGAREYQEDSMGHWFDADQRRLFAVVADGAGGHGGGAEASQAAVCSAESTWAELAGGIEAPQCFLREWMILAHQAVNEAAAKVQRSARTVVVACIVDGEKAHWVHAGDCRLLRFRGGKLEERTRDDSVVQVLLDQGEITEEEMGTHPDQSRLLQSLGGSEPPTPRLGEAELEDGDALILCSDGFWEHLKPAELENLTATPVKRRQAALDQAVATAVQRGAAKADNTTAIMIHCGDTQSASSARFLLWLLLAAALGSLAAWWLMENKPSRIKFPASTQEIPSMKDDPAASTAQPPEDDLEARPMGETRTPPWPGTTAGSSSDTFPNDTASNPEPTKPEPEP